MSTPLGFVLLVAVPMGLLVVTELWSLVRARRPNESSTADADSSDSAAPASPTTTEVTPGELTITPTDLQLSTGVLALTAAYAVHVALELRTTLAISVAFAATLSVLVVGGLLLSTRFGMPGSDQTAVNPVTDSEAVADDVAPATDGGSSVVIADQAATDSSVDKAVTAEHEPAGSVNTAPAQATEIDSEIEWAETTEPVSTDDSTEESE
ncbi:hypothetical protein [Natronorubrum thiooxidans]|uniref:Signal peptidase, endoplasmic reticulum-type n=1 Tax=Natronorubrum thiooxidans TaxID=308853 RepID=A0A1N7GYX4_9EURY|nr:hypothetical protein [Natronorubrum thiooxidans]SIS17783.1 signal peptidase, endoplasmic reticulum-type [Natronorubrum thiooxidans]